MKSIPELRPTHTTARPVNFERLQNQFMEAVTTRENELLNRQKPVLLIDQTFSEGVDGWEAFGQALETALSSAETGQLEHLRLTATTTLNFYSELSYERLITSGGKYASAALKSFAENSPHNSDAARAPLNRVKAEIIPPLQAVSDATARFELDLLSMTAPRAVQFVECCEGQTSIKLPLEYPGQRLKSVLRWLEGLEVTGVHAAREKVLKRILSLEPKYRLISGQWPELECESQWSEEVAEDKTPRFRLPVFDGSSEGQVSEEWFCFSGALLFLNKACGYRLCDLELKALV